MLRRRDHELALDGHVAMDRVEDALGHAATVLTGFGALEEDSEFVTADAGGDVGRANA